MQSHTRAFVHTLLGLLALLVPAHAALGQTLKDLYPQLRTLTAAGWSSSPAKDAISMSGDMLAVGAPNDQVGGNAQQGVVRVFTRSGGMWTLQQTVTASDGEANDRFGTSVSLSGATLAVGVPGDKVGANLAQGSVRVFTLNGGAWTPQATLTASDGADGDQFGETVSLSGDTVVAGVPQDTVNGNALQGSVRVFTRSGSTWTAQATLTLSDPGIFPYFGRSLSLSGDTLAVGAPLDRVGTAYWKGSVSVFVRNGSAWTQQAKLTVPSGATAQPQFGFSVSLQGDTLAAGAPAEPIGSDTAFGTVRVFTRTGSSWTVQATLVAADASFLGESVSLSGNDLAAGSSFDRVDPAGLQGSVRVFTRTGGVWSARSTLTASSGGYNGRFGTSCEISGDTIAVGVPYDQANGVSQPSVRIFGNYPVWNQTRGIGSSSLASAIGSALGGDRLLVSGQSFSEATGVLDASQKRLTFTALEPITLPSTALMTVATDTVFEKSPDVASGSLSVSGRLVAPVNGTVTFGSLAVGSQGQLVQRGSSILTNQGLSTVSGGTSYLQGIVLGPAVLTGVGGQHRVAGDTDVFSNYSNLGATIIQRGILYIYGTLSNTGTITGNYNNGFLPPEPGDGYAIGGDYIVSADSSIILAEPVWWLRVGGNFDVAINDPARFVMDQATLELTGAGAAQSVEALSRDLGAADSGFATSNYPLGALRLRAGAEVELADHHNNAPGRGAEAVYTRELVVPKGATLVTNGLKVYARAATIAGSVSDPDDIVVVPGDAPCAGDIVPDGAVNGIDLALVLAGWGATTPSTAVADIDGDGMVGATDLAVVLSSWGACPQS